MKETKDERYADSQLDQRIWDAKDEGIQAIKKYTDKLLNSGGASGSREATGGTPVVPLGATTGGGGGQRWSREEQWKC